MRKVWTVKVRVYCTVSFTVPLLCKNQEQAEQEPCVELSPYPFHGKSTFRMKGKLTVMLIAEIP